MELFSRRVAVTIDDLKITGLHVVFTITKTSGKDPNNLDLTIYNLSEQHRNQIRAEPKKKRNKQEDLASKILVEAGYDKSLQQLFLGDVRKIVHSYDGTTWKTVIQAGDGEVALGAATSNWSFGSDAKIEDVIEKLTLDLVVDSKDAVTQVKRGDFKKWLRPTFLNGFTAAGPTKKYLNRVFGLVNWTIQDGALQLTPPGQTITSTKIMLDPKTGLIGSPELGEKRSVNVKALLRGSIRPGSRVHIDSVMFKGDVRVTKVTHRGDTHGTDWYTEMETKICQETK